MTDQVDVLVFVEDPGAANMVLNLTDELAHLGLRAVLAAANHAVEYLEKRRAALRVVPLCSTAECLLEEFSPRLLVTGTCESPDSVGLALIDTARRQGIMTVALVDMSCNTEWRFRGRSNSPLTYAPDRLIVPDDTTKKAFISLGYPAESVAILEHPHYEWVRRRKRELEVAIHRPTRERPLWVFVAEGFDRLQPGASLRSHDYTLLGRGDTDWRTGIVLEEILDAITDLSPKPEIVVRPHPKSSIDDFKLWAKEVCFNDEADPLAGCIWGADAVLGMTSMLIVESAILGRPVLSVLPREMEKEWLGPLTSGRIRYVADRAKLRAALRQIAGGYWPSTWKDTETTEESSERIAGYLTKLCMT
jgi:hypothetical protein